MQILLDECPPQTYPENATEGSSYSSASQEVTPHIKFDKCQQGDCNNENGSNKYWCRERRIPTDFTMFVSTDATVLIDRICFDSPCRNKKDDSHWWCYKRELLHDAFLHNNNSLVYVDRKCCIEGCDDLKMFLKWYCENREYPKEEI